MDAVYYAKIDTLANILNFKLNYFVNFLSMIAVDVDEQRRTRCLAMLCTVRLHNVLLKFE